MKTMERIVKPLSAIALALMLALASMSAVFAAASAPSYKEQPGPFTVTIQNAEGLVGMQNDQFSAYQVFSGKVYYEEGSETTFDPEFGSTWHIYSLGDIEWGASMNPAKTDELGATLKSKTDVLKPIADALSEIAEPTAADIAEALAGLKTNQNEILQAFCALLVGSGVGAEDSYLLKTAEGSDPAHTSYPIKSTLEAGANPAEDKSNIQVPEGGYYLIIEENAPAGSTPSTGHEHTNQEYSEYILAVAGNQTIQIKADIPTLHKGIVEAPESGTVDGTVAGVGDTVAFRLDGSLPKNYGDYDWYDYAFVDTLSKGLTLQENSFVITVIPDKSHHSEDLKTITMTRGEDGVWKGSIESQKYVYDDETGTGTATPGNYPQLTIENAEDGSTHFRVDFGDLKVGYDDYNLTAQSMITIDYNAVVNSDAVVGEPGNPNTSHLEFSNDPNERSHQGKSPDDIVLVFTLDLQLVKVDHESGREPENIPLEGATFYLSKQVGEDVYYYRYNAEGDADTKATWVKSEDGTTVPAEATALKTNADGQFNPSISGLDGDVVYTLHETTPPAGYNTIDDIIFSFTVTLNDAKTEITNIVCNLVNADAHKGDVTFAVHKPDETEDAAANGYITVTVVDPRAPFLPFTGGIGNTIFLVGGCVLFGGAVVFLIFSGKKSRKSNS